MSIEHQKNKNGEGPNYQAGLGIDAVLLGENTLAIDLSDYQAPGVHLTVGTGGFSLIDASGAGTYFIDPLGGGFSFQDHTGQGSFSYGNNVNQERFQIGNNQAYLASEVVTLRAMTSLSLLIGAGEASAGEGAGTSGQVLTSDGQHATWQDSAGANYEAGLGIDAVLLAANTLAIDLSNYEAPGVQFTVGDDGFSVRNDSSNTSISFSDPYGGGISISSNSGPGYGGIQLSTNGDQGIYLQVSGGGGVEITDTTGGIGLRYHYSDNPADAFEVYNGYARLSSSHELVLNAGGITNAPGPAGQIRVTAPKMWLDQTNLVVGYGGEVLARLHVRGASASVGFAALFENSAGLSLLAVRNGGGVEVGGSLTLAALSGTGIRALDVDAAGKLIAGREIIEFGKLVQYSPVASSGLAETSLLTGESNGTRTFNSSSHLSNPELYTGASYGFLGGGTLATAATLGGVQLRLKLGGANVADTGAVSLGGLLLASTTYHARLELDLDVRALGVAGSVFVTGRLVLTHPASGQTIAIPFGPATATTLDTTIDRVLDFTVEQTGTAAVVRLETFKVIPLI